MWLHALPSGRYPVRVATPAGVWPQGRDDLHDRMQHDHTPAPRADHPPHSIVADVAEQQAVAWLVGHADIRSHSTSTIMRKRISTSSTRYPGCLPRSPLIHSILAW